jgi:hypothetical protein
MHTVNFISVTPLPDKELLAARGFVTHMVVTAAVIIT